MKPPELTGRSGEPNREQSPNVKDSWLKAVVAGYALWPRRITPGISILATEAVLNDPPDNWSEFLSSTLSPTQTRYLARALRPYYKKDELPYESERGIPSIVTVDESRTPDGEIHLREGNPTTLLDAVQLLWLDTTDIVAGTILDIVHGSRSFLEEEHDGSLTVKTISREALFREPGLIAKVPTARRTIAAAKSGLLSVEGLELAELAQLGGSISLRDGNERHKYLLNKYKKMHEELHPFEESEEFFRLHQEVTGQSLTPMTTEEIFAGERDWHFRHICTDLVDGLIKTAIDSAGLPQKFSNWISY